MSERLSIDEGAMISTSPSQGVELETVSENMTAPDDTFEEDYDIVEVDRTPAFENDGKFAKIKKVASVLSSEISLVNTIVGAGILSLPMAMYKFGLIVGIILVLLMGTLGFFGMWFLAHVGDELYKREQKKNNGKFPDVNVCFTWVGNQISPALAALLNVVLFVYLIGVLIAYLIVIADAFPVVCRSYLYEDVDDSESSVTESDKEWYVRMTTKRWFWILVVSIIVWPLSYAKKLDALKYFSALMLPCVTYIIVLLIVKAAGNSSKVEFYPRNTTAFSALSILMFAFSCHMNVIKYKDTKIHFVGRDVVCNFFPFLLVLFCIPRTWA